MKKIVYLTSILFFSTALFSKVILTDKEYDATLQRLKADKKIIQNDNTRWGKLKKSKPEVNYEVIDGEVVIQSIEIPIHNAKPIIYKVKFKVKKKDETKFFPLTLQICATLETKSHSDGKIGVQFFSLKPLIKHSIGLNFLMGLRSAGASISYTFPKPFGNTSVHVFSGMTYTIENTYGIGVSANL